MIYPTVAGLNLLSAGHQIPNQITWKCKQLEGRINIMILVKGYKYAAIIIAFGLVCHIKFSIWIKAIPELKFSALDKQ